MQIGVPSTLLALPHLQRGLCILSGHAPILGAATSPSAENLQQALNSSATHEAALAAYSGKGLQWDEETVTPTPFRLGTYLIEYQDPRARSTPKSHSWEHTEEHTRWLISVTSLALDAFAVLIFNSLSFSHNKGFTLGFFCPWRCLNDRVTKLFTSDAIDDSNKRTTLTLLDTLEKSAGKKWQSLTIREVRDALEDFSSDFANFLVIGTSISSASASVRHSVVFIPRHTKFTGQTDQAVVSCTRATGAMLLFCPLSCRDGFFVPFSH